MLKRNTLSHLQHAYHPLYWAYDHTELATPIILTNLNDFIPTNQPLNPTIVNFVGEGMGVKGSWCGGRYAVIASGYKYHTDTARALASACLFLSLQFRNVFSQAC
jgi:hypothetical protein